MDQTSNRGLFVPISDPSSGEDVWGYVWGLYSYRESV